MFCTANERMTRRDQNRYPDVALLFSSVNATSKSCTRVVGTVERSWVGTTCFTFQVDLTGRRAAERMMNHDLFKNIALNHGPGAAMVLAAQMLCRLARNAGAKRYLNGRLQATCDSLT